MPLERPGRPRGYGSGVTHSTIYGSREHESNEVEALKQQLLNAQKEKNEEVEKIKEEMQDKYLEMQEKYISMQAKYDEIQSRYEDTAMEMISMRKIFESFNQGLNTSNNPFVKKGHIKELHTKSPVISRSIEGVRRVTSSLPIFDSQHITEKDGNFELPRCKVIDPLDPLRVVAEGRLSSTNPNDCVHGVRLGPDGVRVFIDKVLVPKAPL